MGDGILAMAVGAGAWLGRPTSIVVRTWTSYRLASYFMTLFSCLAIMMPKLLNNELILLLITDRETRMPTAISEASSAYSIAVRPLLERRSCFVMVLSPNPRRLVRESTLVQIV